MDKYKKLQPCTQCGKPDEFSDETLCHTCIESWRAALEKKAYDKALDDVENLIVGINYEPDSDWNNFVVKFFKLKNGEQDGK